MRLRPAVVLICLSTGMAGAQAFTSVEEVKPILTATQGSWIAIRNWQGQDLVYFTNIESWRCGLREIRYSVNGGTETRKTMEPCYRDAPSPNAFQDEAHLPYVAFPPGSVERISVTLVFADGSTAQAEFERAQVELR
jgi:hypothetical protein